MSRLLDLPTELLHIIVQCVKPHDVENFTLSCKRVHEVARNRLIEHRVLKAGLREVESGSGHFPGRYRFSELLELILVQPRHADYVSRMVIAGWYHCQYSESMLSAFAAAVKSTKLIPCEEKEDWISKIKRGNENPVIALLLTRLHCLSSISIDLNLLPDDFILKTVKRIVKAPGLVSLAQLRKVEINGGVCTHRKWRLATAFAALPSVVSLTACCLAEESRGSAEPSFDVAPLSSAVQDLNIDRCRVSEDAVLNIIASTRSLRSFRYCRPRASTHPFLAWICGALVQHASTSLENLTLCCSKVNESLDNFECGFQSYTKLRTLTIDLGLYLGDEIRTADMILDLLPASLEVLTFLRCYTCTHAWLTESVQCMIKSKKRKLPHLRKLNFLESTLLESCIPLQFLQSLRIEARGVCTPLQIRSLHVEALEAGIELTIEGREPFRMWDQLWSS